MKSNRLTVKSRNIKWKEWKIQLKDKVKEKVFSELCLEAQSKTKLNNLKYEFLLKGNNMFPNFLPKQQD